MSRCAVARWREILPIALLMFGASAFVPATAEDVDSETLLRDLEKPTALAVRPGGTADKYEILLAESGAGRVVRWTNLTPAEKTTAIEGFASGDTANGSPLALAFLDPGLLVVGGERDEIQGLIRIFELTGEDESLVANKPRERVASTRDEAACLDFTRTRANEFVQDQLIAVVRGADGQNQLRKLRIQAGTLGAVQPFVEAGPAADAGSFVAVATSPRGRIVAVRNDDGGSAAELVFFSPIDGSVELSMPLDLRDVVALAYSPTTDRLFALDGEQGLVRIDDTSRPAQPSCRATKISAIANPTALAFAPDGTLYITTAGTARNNGTLESIAGSL